MIVNGDVIANVPDLLDRYDRIVVPCGDVVEEGEKAALDADADKLVIESPKTFSQTVLRDVFPAPPRARVRSRGF